ncbi:MAG: hypothetical protein IJM54_05140 [Thermoguttaceae bacterium]|nr:hypothetical protein [Thermoguttaceae bacterium]
MSNDSCLEDLNLQITPEQFSEALTRTTSRYQILKVLHRLIAQYVRDRAVSRTRREVNGDYVNPTRCIQGGYEEMSPESRDFFINQLLPYAVDTTIEKFLDLLGVVDRKPLSLSGKELAPLDPSDDAVRFALTFQRGSEYPRPIGELFYNCQLGALFSHNWKEDFSKYPSSEPKKTKDEAKAKTPFAFLKRLFRK